jgi:hypothetical protein
VQRTGNLGGQQPSWFVLENQRGLQIERAVGRCEDPLLANSQQASDSNWLDPSLIDTGNLRTIIDLCRELPEECRQNPQIRRGRFSVGLETTFTALGTVCRRVANML